MRDLTTKAAETGITRYGKTGRMTPLALPNSTSISENCRPPSGIENGCLYVDPYVPTQFNLILMLSYLFFIHLALLCHLVITVIEVTT